MLSCARNWWAYQLDVKHVTNQTEGSETPDRPAQLRSMGHLGYEYDEKELPETAISGTRSKQSLAKFALSQPGSGKNLAELVPPGSGNPRRKKVSSNQTISPVKSLQLKLGPSKKQESEKLIFKGDYK